MFNNVNTVAASSVTDTGCPHCGPDTYTCQFSPRATRRWAEELRRSPMTVIRKCRNRATPKVFISASKGKKGSLQRFKIYSEKPDSEIAASDNVWVPGLEDNEKEKGNDENK